jgi:hypothetical protein
MEDMGLIEEAKLNTLVYVYNQRYCTNFDHLDIEDGEWGTTDNSFDGWGWFVLPIKEHN